MHAYSVHGSVCYLAALGTWDDVGVRLLSLPSLEEQSRQILDGGTFVFTHVYMSLHLDIICHSILMESFDGTLYVFAAQGDGNVTTLSVNASLELHIIKRVLLGSKSIHLYAYPSPEPCFKNIMDSDGNLKAKGLSPGVFVASDRPTIIHPRNGKLLYSSVNLAEVKHMCRIRPPTGSHIDGLEKDSPDTIIALNDGTDFRICNMDRVQKLHVRSISLGGEMGFRIAHQEDTKTFGVITGSVTESGEQAHFRVLDQYSMQGKFRSSRFFITAFSFGFI